MIGLLWVLAGPAPARASALDEAPPSWGGLRDTADTLPRGEWAVRLPTGRTALGIRDGTELWVQPVALAAAGTRVGVEQVVLARGGWRGSLSPSVAGTWAGTEGALELRAISSHTAGPHRLNLSAAGRGRLLRQAQLGEERTHTLSMDRLLLPVAVGYDYTAGRSVWRGELTVAALDEGEALPWGTLSASRAHAFRRLHVEPGVGLLVGSPSEHFFLGRYQHTLVTLYPTLDLWWAPGR